MRYVFLCIITATKTKCKSFHSDIYLELNESFRWKSYTDHWNGSRTVVVLVLTNCYSIWVWLLVNQSLLYLYTKLDRDYKCNIYSILICLTRLTNRDISEYVRRWQYYWLCQSVLRIEWRFDRFICWKLGVAFFCF